MLGKQQLPELVVGFRGLICCTQLPPALLPGGKGSWEYQLQIFPLQKAPSRWILGRTNFSPLIELGGSFPSSHLMVSLLQQGKKSKEPMEKAEFGIPERKTKVFPPWPSSASELEECSLELCCSMRGCSVLHITSGLSLPCENNPVTPKNLLSCVMVRRIWTWNRDFLGWELFISHYRQQQSCPSMASSNMFLVNMSKLLWINFQFGLFSLLWQKFQDLIKNCVKKCFSKKLPDSFLLLSE